MFIRSCCIVVLFLLACLPNANAKSMWGSRRKKDKDDNIDKSIQSPKSRSVPSHTDNESVDNVAEMMDAYLQIVEDLLNGDDFHTIVNPESISSLMENIPGFEDNDQLKQLMESPEFTNPVLLKKTVRDGVQMLRLYAQEIIDTLKNPVKFTEFLEQLPPEMVELVKGLRSGDTSVLMNFIDNLPGIEESQKSMLRNILSGDTDALTLEIKEMLGDPDKVENLRSHFMENPELSEALGISSDLLGDPRKWAAFVSEGIEKDSFSSGSGSARSEFDVNEKLKKLRKEIKSTMNRAA